MIQNMRVTIRLVSRNLERKIMMKSMRITTIIGIMTIKKMMTRMMHITRNRTTMIVIVQRRYEAKSYA